MAVKGGVVSALRVARDAPKKLVASQRERGCSLPLASQESNTGLRLCEFLRKGLLPRLRTSQSQRHLMALCPSPSSTPRNLSPAKCFAAGAVSGVRESPGRSRVFNGFASAAFGRPAAPLFGHCRHAHPGAIFFSSNKLRLASPERLVPPTERFHQETSPCSCATFCQRRVKGSFFNSRRKSLSEQVLKKCAADAPLLKEGQSAALLGS